MIVSCAGMRCLIAPHPVPLPVNGTRERGCDAMRTFGMFTLVTAALPLPASGEEGWGEGPNATSFLPGHFGEEALSEGLAQAGEDLLGVEFEEARLVGAGGVKDE